MQIQKININQCDTTQWSGGSSTQLFIFPADANYNQRNFDIRISSAKVELETSDFTALPGFMRWLMVLDGEIQIQHQKGSYISLPAFHCHTFDGAWETNSIGKCTDFNLMLRPPLTGNIEAINLEKEQVQSVEITKNTKFIMLFLKQGELEISFETDKQKLLANEVIIINEMNYNLFNIKSISDSTLIITSII
jgi:environmental stress-induced protein Ves